jgi:hypothetical protein
MKQKLKQINSMTKISSQTISKISKNKVKGRNNSIIRDGIELVSKNKDYTNSLLKIGGGILENHGKISLRQNRSSNRKDRDNKILFKNFNYTKISVMNSLKKEIGSKCNSLSVNRNTTSICNDYMNSHKNYNINRSISPIIKKHKIFSSSTNDKITKSALPSPNRSITKKKGINRNNYLNLNNIKILNKNKFRHNDLGKKFGKKEYKLKLKYFKCIQNDKNGITPKQIFLEKMPKQIAKI